MTTDDGMIRMKFGNQFYSFNLAQAQRIVEKNGLVVDETFHSITAYQRKRLLGWISETLLSIPIASALASTPTPAPALPAQTPAQTPAPPPLALPTPIPVTLPLPTRALQTPTPIPVPILLALPRVCDPAKTIIDIDGNIHVWQWPPPAQYVLALLHAIENLC